MRRPTRGHGDADGRWRNVHGGASRRDLRGLRRELHGGRGPRALRARRAIAAELGRLGQRSPEAFKFMRKAIGFKANALAELLDVTPETVSRWENGGLPVEPRAFALLGAMAAEALEGRDATLLRLRALRSPLKVTQPVHVKVA